MNGGYLPKVLLASKWVRMPTQVLNSKTGKNRAYRTRDGIWETTGSVSFLEHPMTYLCLKFAWLHDGQWMVEWRAWAH